MNGLFTKLDDESFFCDFVTSSFQTPPEEIARYFPCSIQIDSERVQYAHKEYSQNIGKFSVLLHSRNPDHYKRAASLLHALYQSNIISSISFHEGEMGDLDTFESGFTRLSYNDEQHVLRLTKFYEEYHNQFLSFNVSYSVCSAYEAEPRAYDFDYLMNMCRYLKANTNINVDSFFMIFKSLMK